MNVVVLVVLGGESRTLQVLRTNSPLEGGEKRREEKRRAPRLTEELARRAENAVVAAIYEEREREREREAVDEK